MPSGAEIDLTSWHNQSRPREVPSCFLARGYLDFHLILFKLTSIYTHCKCVTLHTDVKFKTLLFFSFSSSTRLPLAQDLTGSSFFFGAYHHFISTYFILCLFLFLELCFMVAIKLCSHSFSSQFLLKLLLWSGNKWQYWLIYDHFSLSAAIYGIFLSTNQT